jgi:hypothetical protein
VAFYLAHCYHATGKLGLAKKYLDISIKGFNKQPSSVYGDGKLAELKSLSMMMKGTDE